MEICLINFWTGICSAAYSGGDGVGYLAVTVMGRLSTRRMC